MSRAYRFPGAAALLAAAFTLAACAAGPRLTPYSAGETAARLANERCQERYGSRPFHAEDYDAELVEGRWTWGGEGSRPVDGFSVEVSFGSDGSDARVKVDRSEESGNPEGL